MDSREQDPLSQIEQALARDNPRLASKLSGRRLRRNSSENAAFRQNAKVAALATVIGLVVVLAVMALAIMAARGHAVHAPDVPYGGYGS